jgi:3-demethylubiquinone-9 3-methyltransferase
MRVSTIVVAVLAASCMNAVAGDSPKGSGPASREDIRKLFEVTHADTQAKQLLAVVMGQFKKSIPDVPDELWEENEHGHGHRRASQHTERYLRQILFRGGDQRAGHTIGDQVLMAADVTPERYAEPKGFSLSLQMSDTSEAERIFSDLANEGRVVIPLAQTFWAARFGMVVDRFGIPWLINCDGSDRNT